MEKPKFFLEKAAAFFVIAIACIVITGWFLNIPQFKSILPNWATMKFSTAACFLFSGILTLLIIQYFQQNFAFVRTLLPIATFLVLFIMAAFLGSNLTGVNMGLENLFVREQHDAIHTPVPGRPSIPTMISFLAVGSVGLTLILNSANARAALKVAGIILILISVPVYIGYGLNIPLLFYSFPDISTAMAFHTAILFSLLGVSFLRISKATAEPQP